MGGYDAKDHVWNTLEDFLWTAGISSEEILNEQKGGLEAIAREVLRVVLLYQPAEE